MNEIYFYNLNSPEEVKRMYIALVKEHHASLTMMAIINAEYHIKLKSMDGQPNGRHTYRYNENAEQKSIVQIAECMETGIFHHSKGMELNLVGTWLWAYGDTYPQRAILAGLGFVRDYKRRMWYWRPNNEYKRSQGALSGFVGDSGMTPVEVMS